MRCDYPHFADEETEAEGDEAKELSVGGAKVQSHICLTSKPTSFHISPLQALDEVWSLAMALQIASHMPIELQGLSVE